MNPSNQNQGFKMQKETLWDRILTRIDSKERYKNRDKCNSIQTSIYWSENWIYTKNSANTILLPILIWYKELIWVKEYMKKEKILIGRNSNIFMQEDFIQTSASSFISANFDELASATKFAESNIFLQEHCFLSSKLFATNLLLINQRYKETSWGWAVPSSC